MKRLAIALATAAAGFALAAGTTLAAGPPRGWNWLLGYLGEASIGRTAAHSALFVGAYYGGSVPADLSAGKIVVSSRAGNFEFEHKLGVPNSSLVGLDTSGKPTPIEIGLADGQNLTPLVVSGQEGMTPYLQSWQVGGQQVSGIGPLGHLRLNGVALVPTVSAGGSVRLEAILPDGSVQVLVPVKAGG